MMFLRRRKKKEDLEEVHESTIALNEAKIVLEQIKARDPEVKQVANQTKELGARNQFGIMLEQMLTSNTRLKKTS